MSTISVADDHSVTHVIAPGRTSPHVACCEHENGSVPLELLTSKEAAGFLRVSESTIRRWRRENKLPYVRIGSGNGKNKTVRFRLEDLRRTIEDHLIAKR